MDHAFSQSDQDISSNQSLVNLTKTYLLINLTKTQFLVFLPGTQFAVIFNWRPQLIKLTQKAIISLCLDFSVRVTK